MSAIPSFADVHLDPDNAPPPAADLAAWEKAATAELGHTPEPWETPEGIAVKPVYTAKDLEGLDFLDTMPGVAPYLRGPYPTMYVEQAVDVAPVRRLLHGRGLQRLLPAQSGGGAEGAFHRLRSGDAPGLRLRRSAGRRRMWAWPAWPSTRSMTCAPVRRHPARRDERVDDHERRGLAGPGALHRCGRGAGRRRSS